MSKRLASSLGLTEALSSPRSQWGEPEARALVHTIRKRTSGDILRTLQAADVWAVACDQTLQTIVSDESLRANGLVIEVENQQLGRTQQIVHALTYAHTPLPMESRGLIDTIGGHTRQILEECGYRADEIADLFARRVVA
jgi:crotonobetainyl-CoA:carnitine CoA-transferase CaiB-like acyl-CoA transferase